MCFQIVINQLWFSFSRCKWKSWISKGMNVSPLPILSSACIGDSSVTVLWPLKKQNSRPFWVTFCHCGYTIVFYLFLPPVLFLLLHPHTISHTLICTAVLMTFSCVIAQSFSTPIQWYLMWYLKNTNFLVSDHWCRHVLPWEGRQSQGVALVWISFYVRRGGLLDVLSCTLARESREFHLYSRSAAVFCSVSHWI